METVDQIENIVALMTPEVKIDSVVDNGDGTQTINACNTYWIRKRLIVTIDGNDYKVSAFNQDVDFTIPSTPLVTADSFSMPAPFYFHGTPRQANNEYFVKREVDKYPAIYLVESMLESFYNEEDSREKDANLRIFFLDSFDSNKDEVDGHYDNRIKPLVSSLNYFVDLLNNDSRILPFDYDKTNRVKVGVETTNAGNTSQITNDPLNAVEFVSTVTWLKSNDDCTC